MVCAGRRSRKSLISKRKILTHALLHDGFRYFHAAPSWEQAKEIFWQDLKYDTEGIRTDMSESELSVTLCNGSMICVRSLDRAYRLEGTPWNGFHLTEYPNAKPGIWEANLRPLLADTKGFAIIDGVPDMHSPVATEYYNMAKMAAGGLIPETMPMAGAYADSKENPEWCYYSWFSSDVLDNAEIESIRKTTDPKMFAQEYEGSFQKLSGLCYYAYVADRYPAGNLDDRCRYDSAFPLYVGIDFNVDPMSAVVGHIRKGESGAQEVFIHKGYFLRNSNTTELMERIIIEHPDSHTLHVTPCQSSTARQTVADLGVTDLRIIQQVCARNGRVCVVHRRSKNPRIKDRLNACNAMLFSKRLRINPSDAGLKELQKDWDGIVWKEGTSDLNLSDPMRGHISAALDYMIEYFFPIRMDAGGMQYMDKVIL